MTALSDRVAAFLRAERSPWQLGAFTAAVFLVFAAALPGTFPSAANLQSMGFQFPETGLLGLGVMLSMVTGGIDLSLVAIVDLAGVTTAEFFHLLGGAAPAGGTWWLAAAGALVALGVGAACGLVNGLLVGGLRIPPILATLATLEFFGGLAIAWTGGQAVVGLPPAFLVLGNASPFGIPIPVLLFAAAAAAAAVLLNRHRQGLLMTLVGANPTAARFSGMRTPRILLKTYVASGLLAALAGIIIVARTASATPDYGQSYILLSVVIAVLAGVDPNGGFGTVTGVVLATLCLIMIQTGFDLLGYSQFLHEIAQGVILVLVLALQAAGWGRGLPWRRRRAASALPASLEDRGHVGRGHP